MDERPGMEDRIDRARRGDRSALGELVAELYPRVFRFCARRLGDDLGQDAAQETFLTVQRTIRRFEGRSSFETWLLGVADNHCRNLARKRMRDPLALDAAFEAPVADHGSRCADGETLRCALEKLSPEHRETVILHEVEGLTYAEVAEVLGVPEGTVKSRLYHAFRNLREIIGEVHA